MTNRKMVLMTGASLGIGAAIMYALLNRGYNVVGTARKMSRAGFATSPQLALAGRDIGHAATAEMVSRTAMTSFGSIAVTLSFAIEYAKDHIRSNAVVPGVVGTSLHKEYRTNL
jgi:NAD(P)-dependent dehydrogenase (short-subunit alcohol dehydrogenase family)